MFDNILKVAQSKTTNNFISTIFVSVYVWSYVCVSEMYYKIIIFSFIK